MRSRWLAVIILSFFLLLSGQAGLNAYSGEVFFADSNLEQAVREALGPGVPLTADNVANLSELYANGRQITDLTGLEYATGLHKLKLHDNMITDISPLAALTKLKTLYLSNNRIEDINPLESLTSLNYLNISSTKVSLIAPLADKSLSELNLSNTEVSDLTPISAMTSLTSLSLEGLSLISLDQLAGLIKLKYLYANNNMLTNLEGIEKMSSLQVLYAGHNRITDISRISGLQKLHTLKLWHNQIGDISPLLELNSLSKLYITGNPLNSSGASVLNQLLQNGVSVDVKPQSIPVTGITLDPTAKSLQVGESIKLVAVVLPKDAANQGVTWSSENTKVAKVDGNGKVVALAPGTTTIKVKSNEGGKWATCAITVTGGSATVPATGVSLSQDSLNMAPGHRHELTAEVIPADASDKTLVWASDNEAAAKVDSKGKVTAIAPGSANISVTSKDGNHSASCQVTVSAPEPDDVAFKYTNITLKSGKAKKLPLIISPKDAWAEWSWQSSNPAIAAVDENGTVTALAPGSTEITVTNGPLSATCTLTVVNPDVSEINCDLKQPETTLSIPKELLEEKTQLNISHGKMQIIIPTRAWQEALAQLETDESVLIEVAEFEPAMTGNLKAVGAAYSFQLTVDEVRVSAFADKLLLTIKYDSNQVKNPEKLAIYWHNPDTGCWDKLPSIVDADENTVSALITHWSSFALLQPEAVNSRWLYVILAALGLNTVIVLIWFLKRR